MSAEWAKKERLAPGAQGTHHKICGAAGDASHREGDPRGKEGRFVEGPEVMRG